MRKIFEAADGQPDADDVCFVSNGCTALQIAALYPPLTEQEEQKLLSTRGRRTGKARGNGSCYVTCVSLCGSQTGIRKAAVLQRKI